MPTAPAPPPFDDATVEPVTNPVATAETSRVEPVAPPAGPASSVVEPAVASVEPAAAAAERVVTPVEPRTSVVGPVAPGARPRLCPPRHRLRRRQRPHRCCWPPQPRRLTLDQPDRDATTVVEPVAPDVPPIALEAEEEKKLRTRRRRATRSPEQSHSTWFSIFTWVRNIGIIVLLFVAWQLWGTAIAQHQAQDQLKSQFDAAIKFASPATRGEDGGGHRP